MGIRIGKGTVVHAVSDGAHDTLCGKEGVVTQVEAPVTCKPCIKALPMDAARENTTAILRAAGQAVPKAPTHQPVVYTGYDIAAYGPGTVLVFLSEGDTAEAPGTTKKHFTGTGQIAYIVYADGGMEVDSRDASVTLTHRPLPDAGEPLSLTHCGRCGLLIKGDDSLDRGAEHLATDHDTVLTPVAEEAPAIPKPTAPKPTADDVARMTSDPVGWFASLTGDQVAMLPTPREYAALVAAIRRPLSKGKRKDTRAVRRQSQRKGR